MVVDFYYIRPTIYLYWISLLHKLPEPLYPLEFIDLTTFIQLRMPSEDSKSTSKKSIESEDDDVCKEFVDFFKNLSLASASKVFTKQLLPPLLSTFTYHNIKHSVIFLSVLLLAIVTGVLNSIQFLAEYSILFLREFNGFISAITPFMLGVLDLISKAIGGFYLLIAMMWRGNSGPPVGAQNFIGFNQKQQLQLPPAHSEDKTYADLRYQNQRYQNHDRNRSTVYRRR